MEEAEVLRRLAFIKYLYHIGVEQAGKPEPMCWASVLTLHDAVELFLELSLEYLGSSGKSLRDMRFMDYWNALNPLLKEKGKEGLTHKIQMERLNGARVELKHHGTPPSKHAIENFRSNVASFFEENTPTIFGINFADVTLVNLVKYEVARKSLEEAENLLRQNNIEDSISKVALAFAQLVDDYESRKINEYGRSPFFFGDKLTFLNSFFMKVGGDLGKFIDKAKEAIEALQEAVKVLSLGLDYRKYCKFRLLTPFVYREINGEYYVSKAHSESLAKKLSENDVRFCINFVIEAAILLQEFEFEVSSE
jgi:hypothetical protein